MGFMVGILFGSVGLAYAVYGKRAEEYSFLIFGVLLMVFSYFVPDGFWGIAAGAALVLGPFAARRYF